MAVKIRYAPHITGIVVACGVLAVAIFNLSQPQSPGTSDVSFREGRSMPGWKVFHDQERGFVAAYPSGWSFTPFALSRHRSPTELFTASTGPLEPGNPRGCPLPDRALNALPEDGAMVTVQAAGASQRLPSADFPRRPRVLGPQHADSTSTTACLDDRGIGSREGWYHARFSFSDEHRAFYAYVTWGPESQTERRRAALGIVAGFEARD